MFRNEGNKSYELTKDHKPNEDSEKRRITSNGGQLYQNGVPLGFMVPNGGQMGPVRVHPGRLSVSRTIGDPHAKFERYGGNPDVVIAVPDVTSFKIQDSVHDFIIIASDGIYDRMTTEEVTSLVWD